MSALKTVSILFLKKPQDYHPVPKLLKILFLPVCQMVYTYEIKNKIKYVAIERTLKIFLPNE